MPLLVQILIRLVFKLVGNLYEQEKKKSGLVPEGLLQTVIAWNQVVGGSNTNYYSVQFIKPIKIYRITPALLGNGVYTYLIRFNLAISSPVFSATAVGASIDGFDTPSDELNYFKVYMPNADIWMEFFSKPVITTSMDISSANAGAHSIILWFEYVD